MLCPLSCLQLSPHFTASLAFGLIIFHALSKQYTTYLQVPDHANHHLPLEGLRSGRGVSSGAIILNHLRFLTTAAVSAGFLIYLSSRSSRSPHKPEVIRHRPDYSIMSSNSPPTALPQVALDEDARPRFSDAQLREYLNCIKLPPKYLDSKVLKDATLAGTKEHGLPFLRALTRYHACNVPFDNLVLHYSADKTVTLDQADLYAKIVRRHLGGRCMENNSFFGTVLRSLGY